MRYHLKCCVIVNALIECKIAFFKVVRQSLKSFYDVKENCHVLMKILSQTSSVLEQWKLDIDNAQWRFCSKNILLPGFGGLLLACSTNVKKLIFSLCKSI